MDLFIVICHPCVVLARNRPAKTTLRQDLSDGTMGDDWASATAGAVYKIALTNFMQFDSVSFYPGPHLNVIIGPNGSGK
jgi:hypothetical protein